MVYELIKNLKPIQNHQKIREEDEFLLVTDKDFNFYVFNPLMKDIYLKMDGKTTIEQIIDEIHSEYDADFETIKKDTIQTIRDLQWKKLIFLKS